MPDYQLSLAIGKEGQNARLAARLTGWRIDIRPDVERPGPVGRRRRPPVATGRPAAGSGDVPPGEDSSAAGTAGDRAERAGPDLRGVPSARAGGRAAARGRGPGVLLVDERRVLPGRGAHLHRDPACLDLAERKRAFPRALRVAGPLDPAAVRVAVGAPQR